VLDTHKMASRYQAARNLFLERTSALGWTIRSIEHPLKGPCDIPIFMDIAIGGDLQSDDLILLTSATHGVEGYLGSDMQCNLLADPSFTETKGRTLAMIHGVNPYGFAWHRRVNEDNVDLNRNFIDFDRPLPQNEGYLEFYDFVNPTVWNDEASAQMDAKSREAAARIGWSALFKAVSGGQYDHPQGIQYGGKAPVWSRLTIEREWPQLVRGKRRATLIDFHTGLGPKAYGMMMAYGIDGDPRTIRAKSIWPDILMGPPPGEPGVMTSGNFGPALPLYTPDVEVLSTTLEYGTLEGLDVTRSMVADNWLHQHGEMDSPLGQAIKQQILDAFYIDDPDYKLETWKRCQQVVTDLLNGG
jgi:hypothetical protein